MKLKSNKIIGLILAIFMLIGCLPMNIIETYAADGDVQINETNFPDANFREYVKQFDKDNDNILSQIEIDDVKGLDVSRKNITTLKGIEYFTKLEGLNCARNQLTELNVSKNTALISLDCSRNQLKELDVSNNTALDGLACEENRLTKLDVSNNPVLNGLYCHNNQLTSLKLNSVLNSKIRIEIINQEYNIELPEGTSELKFPEGFDTSRIVGTIPGVTINPDGKLIWDEKSEIQNIQYKLIDGSDKVVTIVVKLTEVNNPELEAATKLVETAEKDKTKAAYDTAKEAVDKLAIGSGKTGLEERLKVVREYLDKLLKEAKDKALEEIGKLANLTDDEKAPFITRVNDATTIPEVKKAVEDAKKADAAKLKDAQDKAKEEIGKLPNLTDDGKAPFIKQVDDAKTIPQVEKAVEDAKNADDLKAYKEKAKEEIGNLPNLDDQEKKDFKGQVDEQTDKPGVDKVVEEAKKKNAENGGGTVVPTPTPTPTPTPKPDYNYREIYFALPLASAQKTPETKKKVTIETIITIGSNKLIKKIDGIATETEMDVAAYIKGDRTYIPLRFVGEALGYEVTWDEVNRTAILKNKDKEVKIAVDSNVFYVKGERFESDVKPLIKNSRTMIPVGNFARAIGLQDGKEIFWNEATRVVTIKQEIEY